MITEFHLQADRLFTSMSIQVLCPQCNAVTEWHRPPVSSCNACQTVYPAPVHESAESALRRSLAPKPMLLVIGQFLSAITGVMFLGFLIAAPFDAGTYSISGSQVSGPEFLRRVGIPFGLTGVLLLAIAIGLWRERTWSRPLMMLYWLLLPLLTISAGDADGSSLLGGLLSAGVCAGFAGWYLYGRSNVRAYFEARASAPPATIPVDT